MNNTTIKTTILQQFNQSILNEGTLWRVADLAYFSSLLAQQAQHLDSLNIGLESNINIFLTGLKALVNEKLGTLDYSSEYKFFNRELYQELDDLRIAANKILNALLETEEMSAKINKESYLHAIHSLSEEPISVSTIEHAMSVMLSYFNKQNDAL